MFLDWDNGREQLVHKAVEANCATRVFVVANKEPQKGFKEAEFSIGTFTHLTPREIRNGQLGKV